jgi:Winged helix DNA-binding domain
VIAQTGSKIGEKLEIADQRLHNQHLIGNTFATPEEVVRWFGAVQSQDYGGAKWGVAQRTKNATNAELDQIFNAGKILRTHIMRPTWHFVMPEDIRWLLKLTSPRVHAFNAHYYRKNELDEAVFAQSNALVTKALQGGNHLTRPELGTILAENGVASSNLRLGLIMMYAELEGLICSGALKGKQFTYALLDERVPPTKTWEHDEALAELTSRYFISHGPATVHDYAWWSGLSVTEARTGLEMVKPQLVSEEINAKTYWFTPPETTATLQIPTPLIHLLPNYDEHVVAYKDHSASFSPEVWQNLEPGSASLLAHIVVRDGLVIGGWKRIIQKKEAVISPNLLVTLSETEQTAFAQAVEAYGRFIGLPARLA